jgi:hypothetical protein
MKLTKKKDTRESQQYWAFVEKTAKEVAGWPNWKKGGIQEPERTREESEKSLAPPSSRRSR